MSKRDCPHYPENPADGCKIPNQDCPKGYNNACNLKEKKMNNNAKI